VTTTDHTNRPPEPSHAELAIAQGTMEAAAAASPLDQPTLEPPGTAAGATAAAAGWLTNKHVLLLWQSAAPMDNWAYLDGGIGWKQLTQVNDVATRGMGLLTSGARVSGGIVNVYEGATGSIDAIYLW